MRRRTGGGGCYLLLQRCLGCASYRNCFNIDDVIAVSIKLMLVLVLYSGRTSAFTSSRYVVCAWTTTTFGRRCKVGNCCLSKLTLTPASSTATTTQLHMVSTEPLATKGDWTAYLDDDGTGLIYYFNERTGESVWEVPLDDFPTVSLTPAMRAKAQLKQEEYIQLVEKQQQLQQQQQQISNNSNKSLLSSILPNAVVSNKQSSSITTTTDISSGSLLDTSDMTTAKTINKSTGTESQRQESNDWFNSVVDDVISKRSITTDVEVKKKSITEDAEALSQRMKGDFFDRMFSSGRNLVSGILDKSTSITTRISDGLTSIDDASTVIDKQLQSTSLSGSAAEANIETSTSSGTSSVIASTSTAESSSSTSTPAVVSTVPNVQFATFQFPHPAKARWGGEDAVFVKGRTFGVFDGVTGADKRGGVPLYSKILASEMEKRTTVVDKTGSMGLSIPQMSQLLQQAAETANARGTGASTAIVASVTSDGFLRVLNVGDSGCILVRNGRVTARSRERSHYYECPYQLSVDSPDRPSDGTKLNIELQKNDIVLMASDGIFDNLSEDQIVDIIVSTMSQQSTTTAATAVPTTGSINGLQTVSSTTMTPTTTTVTTTTSITKGILQTIAKRVCEKSRRVSYNRTAKTPYARLAKQNKQEGYEDGVGGKIDDISCVVVGYG